MFKMCVPGRARLPLSLIPTALLPSNPPVSFANRSTNWPPSSSTFTEKCPLPSWVMVNRLTPSKSSNCAETCWPVPSKPCIGMEVGTGRGVAAGSGPVVDATPTGGAGVTNCAVATGVSVTAVGSAETAGVRVGAGVAVAFVVVPAGATASEACVGAGVAVDMGAEGTAVGGVDPEHAVRTNSVRKTNPPC